MFIRAFLNISQTTGCRPASPINRIAFMFTQRSESAPNELIDTSLYNIINAFIFFFHSLNHGHMHLHYLSKVAVESLQFGWGKWVK